MSESPLNLDTDMAGILEFHHLGIATLNLAVSRIKWGKLGYREEGSVFEDPAQGVSGLFLSGPGPRLELLAPLGNDQTLVPWLTGGSNIYHMAYLVQDLSSAIDGLRIRRAQMVREPRESVAFEGKAVAFMLIERGWLVELISR